MRRLVFPAASAVPTAEGRFAALPEPIALERTVASSESGPRPDEKDDYWREVEWLLRVTGAF
jgi:hypothetical protein